MTYRGYVRNGAVVLDPPADLPEGVEVEVHVVGNDREPPGDDTPTLYEQLKGVIGIADGLPSDLARHHDHYLHGQPKKP
jgi:hypothetical protein